MVFMNASMNFTKLYIWGPNPFNNQLFASHITTITGIAPTCIRDREELDYSALSRKTIFFCDCDKTNAESYCQELQCQSCELSENAAIILMNVQQGADLLDEIKRFGVRGVFYSTDPIEQIEQGIKKVLAGEHWLSRELLARSLQSIREELRRNTGHYQPCMLTLREQEILNHIVTGQDNQAIADHLFISPNTVKTHVSNIYKKIEATNRVQAILWASKNANLLVNRPMFSQKEEYQAN